MYQPEHCNIVNESGKNFLNDNKLFKIIFENANEGIIIAEQTSEKFLLVNNAVCKLFGYSREEFLTLSVSDILSKDRLHELTKEFHSIQDSDNRTFSNVPCLKKDGSTIFINIRDSLIEYCAKKYVVGFFADTTEHHKIQQALLESEERWKFAIEGSGLGLWDWDVESNKVFFSKKWKDLLGYKEDEIGDRLNEWSDRVHPEDIEQCYFDLDRHFKKITPIYSNEHRMMAKDGNYIWVHDRGKVIKWTEDGKPKRVIGTHSDISNRKIMEEILRQERDMFVNGPVVTFKWRNEANWPVEYVSPNVKQILGFSSDDFLQGRILYSTLIHKDDLERVSNEVSNFSSINSERFEHQPYRLICNDGKIIWVMDYTTIIRNETGITHYLGYIVDITERKTAEEKILSSLKEKDILLNEIHHRVKNNLQIVISLLSLQEDLITDSSILSIFQDVENRIRTMAIIHEHMYITGNFETIDIQNYIDSLIGYLHSIYIKNKENIIVELDIDPLQLDMDTVIPCGLIITELFSNSFKYAFPDHSHGKILVSMKNVNDSIALKLYDNGIGLPENFEIETLKSLGLRLVKIFAMQIRGTLNISSPGKGVEFTVTFRKI